MPDYRELLIGCGRARDKRLHVPGHTWREWRGLVTLDINPHCGADLWCDLNAQPPWCAYPEKLTTLYRDHDSMVVDFGQEIQQGVDLRTVQFKKDVQVAGKLHVAYDLLPDYWDEIHAYEVLEHLGSQGDAHAFFAQFSEVYRLLKPDGYLCATVPSRYSPWLWGDPSHRRVICQESLVFLDQEQYKLQIDGNLVGVGLSGISPMSDFRETLHYRADFKLIDCHDDRTTFRFILQAVKPSRYKVYANERFGPFGSPLPDPPRGDVEDHLFVKRANEVT